MAALSVGRVQHDHALHAVIDRSLPPRALCGAGIIVERAGSPFPLDDPAACIACVALAAGGNDGDGDA